MKNNELAAKLEEIVGGVPAKNAIEAIDNLIQQVAMGSAKRAKAIIEKIQELETALKAEEELYLSSINRLPGDTPVCPDTFALSPITGRVGCITVGDIIGLMREQFMIEILHQNKEIEYYTIEWEAINAKYGNCEVVSIYPSTVTNGRYSVLSVTIKDLPHA